MHSPKRTKYWIKKGLGASLLRGHYLSRLILRSEREDISSGKGVVKDRILERGSFGVTEGKRFEKNRSLVHRGKRRTLLSTFHAQKILVLTGPRGPVTSRKEDFFPERVFPRWKGRAIERRHTFIQKPHLGRT